MAAPVEDNSLKTHLEELYGRLNRREHVYPDPLAILYAYRTREDLELVGMLSSALAFGTVTQITRSVTAVLALLPDPARTVRESARGDLRDLLAGFRHRWATGHEVADLLLAVIEVQKRYGSLENCFLDHMRPADETVIPGLAGLVGMMGAFSGRASSCLLPDPAGGSACKRLHLFLRWMVRRDAVDPGVWAKVPAGKLVVPMDVHMHRICRDLGFTARKQADIRTALEVTARFREITPEDPVRYDFALTRLGIIRDLDMEDFTRLCRPESAA